jgi:quercetin dioxygenase-like cupin family protein
MPSEDAVKIAPDNYKVLLENNRVRVLEAKLKRGQKTAMHKHPKNLVYVVDSGYARFTSPDGKSQKMRMKAGQVAWFEDQEHDGKLGDQNRSRNHRRIEVVSKNVHWPVRYT